MVCCYPLCKGPKALFIIVFSFQDVTALCILENFGNYQSLTMADRVLKTMGRRKAKESYKVSNTFPLVQAHDSSVLKRKSVFFFVCGH